VVETVVGMMAVIAGRSAVVAVALLAIAPGHMAAARVAKTMEVSVGSSVVVMVLHLDLRLDLLLRLQLLLHLVLNGAHQLVTWQLHTVLPNLKMEVGPSMAMAVQQRKLPTTCSVALWSLILTSPE